MRHIVIFAFAEARYYATELASAAGGDLRACWKLRSAVITQRPSTYERAKASLAGGCDSPVRSGWSVGGAPFVQSRGEGPYAYDESGRRYVDYVMAYGPLLFGHTHPMLTQNLDDLVKGGWVWGATHAEEVRLAERVRSHVPSMQRLRFVTSGTEAVMSAVRVARAFTGRTLVLKFAGNYHGHSDFALLDAGASAHTSDAARSGIPASITRDVSVARYNDLEDVDAILAANPGRLAAIIVEPVVGNMGFVTPLPGFLRGLRERCTRSGALLIFDEVITWLRLGLGGAQAHVDVAPDLTAVGKVMGGGAPIAAFGGRAEVMNVLAPDGETFTGGTHAGNPFCVGMAHRVLDLVEAHPEYYTHMRALAARLADGIRSIFYRRGLDYAVVAHESIVDFAFRPGCAARNYDDARAADRERYALYYHAMRDRGILLPPSQNEVMFVSTAHADQEIDRTLEAIEESLAAIL
ncbi:MAG: glutamate-1-semialdehyde 2,1-aminomutase [Candidatus Eremiobacteraeota bacterium]|nr:glutamate-1-semialdehyde 2,1-aminomutase [Candidatus Eremiobacteraeota bacterium]